jgi:hypothetical protein
MVLYSERVREGLIMKKIMPLKVMAHDREDLEVLSVFMQDALIPLNGMDFDKKEGIFKICASRYRWDLNLQGAKDFERIHAGVTFHDVQSVAFRGFSRSENQAHSLELLAIQYEAPYIYLTFAANAEIRLTVKEIHVRLKDVDDAWPVMHQPVHQVALQKR